MDHSLLALAGAEALREGSLAKFTETDIGDWRYLGRELKRLTLEPVDKFPFVVHVVLAIVIFGALGVWVEVLKIVISTQPADFSGLITAIITFFPALIGSTALQLILSSASKNDKIVISFGLLVLCVFVAAAILLPFFSTRHPLRVLTLGVICSVCAIWVWWITNADDQTYMKMPRADAATGGDVGRQLQGDLKGFEV